MLDDSEFTGDHVWWMTSRGASPIVGTAIHNGHAIRENLLSRMALDDDGRLREEDPFTAETIHDLANRIVFQRSRFEIDLNRARDAAVYQRPEQAWGLKVWREPLSDADLAESLALHDAYYSMLENYLRGVEAQYGAFVVLDIHSYNHRRDGASGTPTAAADAPDINIGTISMDRTRWAPVVDAFMDFCADYDFLGRRLDVRENVAFQGRGEQTRFIHERFPSSGCAIAVEFKKVFMDEWTGVPDWQAISALRSLIAASVPVLESALREVA
ncbi:N-formylglutamate amidohydrolase [Shinella sp.]|uniref:N-formylglutamate amidohydrolase n=1 Tax=Shinella sp. TaxID=1870904 RepID=UPI0028AC0E54|nr:N-formylglutamate amidohydrolase [Shinella sp.]